MKLPGLTLFILIITTVVMSNCSKSTIDPPTPVTPTTPTEPTDPTTPTKPDPIFATALPTKAIPFTVIKISGQNFSTDLSKISVEFENAKTTVISATRTEITVEVPLYAKTGTLNVVSDGITYPVKGGFQVLSGTQSTFYESGDLALLKVGLDVNGRLFGYNGNSVFRVENGKQVDLLSIGFYPISGNLISDKSGNIFFINGIIMKLWPGNSFPFSELRPKAIAIDDDDILYASDETLVRKIDPNGVVSRLAGNDNSGYTDGTGTAASLTAAKAMTIDKQKNVYIMDSKAIRKITPQGVVSTVVDDKTSGYPTDVENMAVDASGNIFVSTTQTFEGSTTNSILMINAKGIIHSFLSTKAPSLVVKNGAIANQATTSYPTGLIFDATGNLYVLNGLKTLSKITFN